MNEVCGICGEEKPSSEVCVDYAYEYDISRDRKEGKLELQISNQAEIIEDLRNPWVSVDERLPAYRQEVLTKHEIITVYNTCIFMLDAHGNDCFESLETGDDLTEDVTHWMEIPDG